MSRIIKKSLRIMLLIIIGILLILLIGGALFMNFSPQFGGKPSQEAIIRYEKIEYYKDGVFENQIPTSMDMDAAKMLSTMVDFIKGVPNSRPNFDIPFQRIDSLEICEWTDTTSLIWFGHSAFLLKMDDKNILIDPMFGDVPAPHPWLGKKRYSNGLPIEVEKLPAIDAIIFSHDHYDHLDYGSIQKLKDKTAQFYVPLGVGAHLLEWGVPAEKIHEMAWWEENNLAGIKLAFTPARHFSGRGFGDRFSTLWGSWVLIGAKHRVYFSGDGGYGPHFKEIGDKYGPFDFAMIECGQYNENWKDIHMMPEESAQAAQDIDAKMMMPIHWGAFTLALHSWTDPVERVSAAADKLKLPYIIPQIGEVISLDSGIEIEQSEWWVEE
jgi:L-ascorbate metabolism protein UlaG (beta-lactamase superfamily)